MKRIRIKSNTARVRPGSLERFLALPTELIFEVCTWCHSSSKFNRRSLQVFKHLHALDLHHMSLTCRTFKQALCEPVSYPLWKAAFSAIPSFPPCPTDLTEPQWAYLMFGPVECEVRSSSGPMIVTDSRAGLWSVRRSARRRLVQELL